MSERLRTIRLEQNPKRRRARKRKKKSAPARTRKRRRARESLGPLTIIGIIMRGKRQYVMFWNGERFGTSRKKAKRFTTRREIRREMAAIRKIKHAYPMTIAAVVP